MREARNNIIHGLLTTVEVDGKPYLINSDFRVGIQCARVLDDIDLSDEESYFILYTLLYAEGNRPPYNAQALNMALEFYIANQFALYDAKKAKGQASTGRSFCWDYDIDLVIADFQREYGIDLCNENLRMHWHRFIALFRGLSADSRVAQIRNIRTQRVSDNAGAEQRRVIDQQKRMSSLPPRNREEHIQQQKARYE